MSEERATDSIRKGGLLKQQGGKWGLPIVRCTYTSDAKWEKYISLIHTDIHNALKEDDSDQDLLAKLSRDVIEDKERLDGATWKEARTKYDEWAWEQIRKFQDTVLEGEEECYMGEDSYQQAKDVFAEWDAREVQPARGEGRKGIPRIPVDKLLLLYPFVEPRWSFFIFADQASVDSVVDHAEEGERERAGCYYFTVVRSELLVRENCVGEDGKLYDDEDSVSFMEETQRKIKAYDLVDVVVSIINSEWGYGYMAGADGICDLF